VNTKEAVSILKETFSEWMEDQAPTLGAALAYYTVFSLAPLLIIAISIAGLLFGKEAAQGQIFDQLRGLLGDESGRAMQVMVQNASEEPATGLVATLVGFVTLLFGASGVFGQLQTSLNAIWGVQPKPGRGILGIIQDRILSFGFILVVGFLLLVSLLLTAAIAFVGQRFGDMVPGMEALAQILNSVFSLAVITLLFAMIFKFLPDARIAWHDVWIGAFITAALFTLGKFALGLYLGKSGVALVRRSRFAYRPAPMGLLFLADRFLWRGIYASLCQSIRLARCSLQQCGCRVETCIDLRLQVDAQMLQIFNK